MLDTYRAEAMKQCELTFPNGLLKASDVLSKISNVDHVSLHHTDGQSVANSANN